MKIVIIGTIASSIYGFRSDMIKALKQKDHEIYAFALDYDNKSREKVIQIGAIPINYKFSRSGLNPISDIINTIKLSKIIKEISPDLVFTYFSKPVIFGTLAAKLAGINNIIGMLEGLGFTFTSQPNGINLKTKLIKKIQIALYKISLPLLDNIIFLNQDDPIDLIKNNNIKIKNFDILGPIGLDLKSYPYSEPPSTSISFIFIGRLLVEKGINDYIQAAKIIKSKYPHISFKILGGIDKSNPGSLTKSTLQSLISDNIVEYPGHISNVTEWISNSSVFVLPSYREGIPRSTQEAMAIGRAVITTDVPGCRETVIDGVNGFLIPPWCPDILIKKMEFFISNPEQIKKMGHQSYLIAKEKFDASVTNKKLLNLLNLN